MLESQQKDKLISKLKELEQDIDENEDQDTLTARLDLLLGAISILLISIFDTFPLGDLFIFLETASRNSQKTYLYRYKIQFLHCDYDRIVNPKKMVNDAVIDLWMAHLFRDKIYPDVSGLVACAGVFYTNARLQKLAEPIWFKVDSEISFLNHKYLLVPVCRETHWICYLICLAPLRIFYFDSLPRCGKKAHRLAWDPPKVQIKCSFSLLYMNFDLVE